MCFLSFYCNKIQIFSRHPVLLNYTPILHETFFRMTLIQVWTIKRSKDIFFFLTRRKTRTKQNRDVLQCHFLFTPGMCDEKQQHRVIILQYTTDWYCARVKKKTSESLIFLYIFFSDGYANSKSVTTDYRGHRDALCPLGQDRNKKDWKIKSESQTNVRKDETVRVSSFQTFETNRQMHSKLWEMY